MVVRREQLWGGHGELVELSNGLISASFLTRGASLWRLRLHGHPSPAGVCLSHPSPADYAVNRAYLGATPGPVANRIGGAAFECDGAMHRLTPNEGRNQLHSGPTGFSHLRWRVADETGDDRVLFRLHRPDGEGGFPGNLDVEAQWTLSGACLRFEWRAVTDAPTPVALTNHAYWNLAGGGTVLGHELVVPAERLVVVDDELIPTGELRPVRGTPFDLTERSRIGDVVERVGGDGLDHCYAWDEVAPVHGPVVVADPATATTMSVTTSLPGVQIYTGGYLDGTADSAAAPRFGGVCVETQHLPDAVNRAEFPSPIVRPGHPVEHWTEYRFDWPGAASR